MEKGHRKNLLLNTIHHSQEKGEFMLFIATASDLSQTVIEIENPADDEKYAQLRACFQGEHASVRKF